ncbi:FAD-dependent oxidoreductase [Oscillatoria amoena NRMC-F 0135]|nr:FAD-dependent oxidoreductase [Geitlerinema splendidum]MDL5044786.1 FAD-dependent oxidoreductase [Oscillatoria amoena NRMC-F 0135]
MSHTQVSTSFWRDSQPDINYSQLQQDITVDVAIVGGGITGLTTALLLQRSGVKVALLEASTLGSGVTGYTTAHLTEVLDTRYKTLLSDFEEDVAQLVAASHRSAIERIADLVVEEQIDCDFQRLPGYLYSESEEDLSTLEAEVEAAHQLGVRATLTSEVPLPFPVKAGIIFPEQAQFHATKYVNGLAKAFVRLGGQIFENTRVLDVTFNSENARVYTQLNTVTARYVVLATHTPIHDLKRLSELAIFATKVSPYRSYVLGVRLNSPLPQGLFWDTAEPYHYTRTYTDASGELAIIGGADHRTGEMADTEEPYQRLEAYARSHYDVASIDYRWSAQLYEPIDGLPFIGQSPINSQLYLATGFSGNGMTFGTLAAMLIADQILGRKNPWTQLYDANRIKPLASAQQFIAHNVDVATRFIADRFKADAHQLSQVAFDEGKILDIEGKQVAAYRDPEGNIQTLSAVCTHLGCIVEWNIAEKSWDCPCHGGRYSTSGQVLNGPPIEPLEPLS